jgi:hypothetical protein
MNWKLEFDALVESTMAFARDVGPRPTPDLPVAVRIAEQALAETAKPFPVRVAIMPTSERDEIKQRVSKFKAHQEKMAREREGYYLQMKAKMLAPVNPDPVMMVRPNGNQPSANPRKSPTAEGAEGP